MFVGYSVYLGFTCSLHSTACSLVARNWAWVFSMGAEVGSRGGILHDLYFKIWRYRFSKDTDAGILLK